MKTDLLDIRHADCMDMMREFPDKHFDLAIVDPPYGIGFDGEVESMVKGHGRGYARKAWDKLPPEKAYFDEVIRCSKNQIIWGANHFISKIPRDSSCWLFWDKQKGDFSLAAGELAYTSFKTALRKFSFQWHGFMQGGEKEERIHPTQKPVALYRWLLQNYAKPGDTILDTHLGSGSIAIACHYAGHHLTACELDADYYKAACERIDRETRQQTLFTETPKPTETQTELI